MLDVNFSFFDPQPQDYHSIKLLLSQLVGHTDAVEMDLGGVTDLVLEQKLVGSTVKTDSGEDDDKASEGDPYAVLTVLNLNVHKVRASRVPWYRIGRASRYVGLIRWDSLFAAHRTSPPSHRSSSTSSRNSNPLLPSTLSSLNSCKPPSTRRLRPHRNTSG